MRGQAWNGASSSHFWQRSGLAACGACAAAGDAVVGYLSFTSPDERPTLLKAFLQGLEQAGYLIGRNVAIEYRSAEGQVERLPILAAELAKLPAGVIAATGGPLVALAAKGATSQIPIVFTMSADPVRLGLVEALNRPGGNVTGVALMSYELDAKRLQMLKELVPKTTTVGVLLAAKNTAAQQSLAEMRAAADVNGQRLVVLNADSEAEIDSAFASLESQHIEAVLVTTNPFYEGRRQQLVALAQRYAVPVLYPWREYSIAGGLISYGPNFTESYHQAGFYVGRILHQEKPADLPVVQATKFELVINRKTAKTVGIEVPTALLLLADEVIE
jgi:putative ABC transport system substrate-binding protein